MASDQNFVDFVIEQIQHTGIITAKKMFGEYGIYGDGKLFGLICAATTNYLLNQPVRGENLLAVQLNNHHMKAQNLVS